MKLSFHKFQATGNDFILIDDRNKQFNTGNNSLIQHLCNRRFGIGADGLILLRNDVEFDFRMIYFNADGYEGSMCGNGGRCIAAFAHTLYPDRYQFRFQAFDGLHEAEIQGITEAGFMVKLSMNAVNKPELFEDDLLLNTGSPHYVQFVNDAASVDVNLEGKRIRNSTPFLREGVNVNFCEVHTDSLTVRTYERGVEEETLSCGTGVTAAAIASHFSGRITHAPLTVFTRGGELQVEFTQTENRYLNVSLRGEAVHVFNGTIEV